MLAKYTILNVSWETAGQSYRSILNDVKGSTENIPGVKDHKGKHITDTIEKANSLNSYYASLFSR